MKKVTFGTVKLMMPATRIAESKRSGKNFTQLYSTSAPFSLGHA